VSRLISAGRACISSPLNVAITAGILYWAATTLPGLFEWTLSRAIWSGSSPRACAGVKAACWLFIRAHFQQILFGSYPATERWRITTCLSVGLVVIGTLVLLHRHKVLLVIVSAAVYPPFAGVLLYGGVLGLPIVPTQNWGGLFLTAVVAGWTIASSLPAGLVLALARRSRLPVVAGLAAIYIDLMRGLPLVGILFVSIIMFPLFVPPHFGVDPLIRALLAFSGFNAAIMAEVIRGALQSVPRGQSEAARALGLRPWQVLALCILPQAMRTALPGIINVSIAIIKETTIILMAGMFDFLGVLQGALIDPQWLIGDQIRQTAYFFAGLVFFLSCFTLSLWSTRLEARLRPDKAV
jgi:general L-amino acid transport system permease protein